MTQDQSSTILWIDKSLSGHLLKEYEYCLEDAGFIIHKVANPDKVWSMLGKYTGQYACIILELWFPPPLCETSLLQDIDAVIAKVDLVPGLALAKQIRQHCRYKKIPIVIFTSQALHTIPSEDKSTFPCFIKAEISTSGFPEQIARIISASPASVL